MTTAIEVRIAQPADADAIAHLMVQLGYESAPRAVADRLSRILDRPDHRFLIAEAGGRPAGWLHAVVFEFVETGPFVVIAGLVVDRSSRQQGVGRLLMSRAEAWAVEKGCSIVRLWSSDARTEAHRFYEHLGYSRIKTQYSFVKSVDPSGRRDFAAFVPRLTDNR
jgi:GNAT superfamily N-acetyltransferase